MNAPALGGSLCDTLGIWNNSGINLQCNVQKLNIFYHSEWQAAFINASGLSGHNYSLHLISTEGKEVYSESGILQSSYYSKSLHYQFASGAYVLLIETEKAKLTQKFIVPNP